MSSSPLAANLDEARRFTEARDYASAIVVFDRLIAQSPTDADLLIEAARVYGWADRNAESAGLYLRVIEVAPARLADIRNALAWQLHWSGQSARALPFFRDELIARPDDREIRHGLGEAFVTLDRLDDALMIYRDQVGRFPDDRRAQKRVALILGWLGRDDEARLAWVDVLNRAPDDREALFHLARLDNRAGRHQIAVGSLATLRAVEDDPETRLEHVRALRWSGDERAARQVLGATEGREAAELRILLNESLSDRVILDAEFSRDSDALSTRAGTAQILKSAGTHGTLDASFRHVWLEQNGANRHGRTLLVGYGWQGGAAGEPGGLWFPAVRVGMRNYDGWDSFAWQARLKWLPADFWRVDFEAGNTVVENVQSVDNEVRFDYVSAGFDHRFAARWEGSLGILLGRFDDGNQRTRGTGRLLYRFNDAPRLLAGVEGMAFRDSDPPVPGRGYWSPDRYSEIKAVLIADARVDAWQLYGKAAVGRLWETPGGSNTLYQIEGSARHPLGTLGYVRFYAGYSDSAGLTQGGGGYWRGYGGATLEILF